MGIREDCLEVKCPRCKAPKGKPCTYVALAVLPEYAYTDATKAKIARVGTPTKVPHLNRLDAYRYRNVRVARNAWKKAKPYVPPPAMFTLRQFDQIEHEQMREWLKKFAPVLTEKERDR